jgi:hypothetical protein
MRLNYLESHTIELVEDSVKKRINTLYRFLTAKVVYHTAFWLTLLILLIFLENGSFNLA